jgi:predicted GIY-YIG superfamily endonuclease
MGTFFSKKRKKPGMVYLGESTRKNGSKKIYTGMTRRSVKVRTKEHVASQSSANAKTWVSRGIGYKLKGAFFSKNPEKAERTVKKLKPHQKKYLARGVAMKYKRKIKKL